MRVKSVLVWLMMLGVWAGATHAYVFDTMDVSSKARGMGGAWAAGADDATAIFYNPACLVGPDHASVAASFLRPNSQSFEALTFLAVGGPIAPSQGIALSYRKFGVEFDGVDLMGESTLSLAHAFTLLKDIHSSLAVGYGINLYMLEFGNTDSAKIDLGRGTTYGIDLGVVGTLRDRTRIGLMLKNINEPSLGKDTKEPLPQWVTAGVSYSPYYGVLTELDLRSIRGEDVEVHMGMQFGLTQFLDMRFGFQTGPNSLTGGLTAKLEPVEIDYAYSTHSVLPGTHHLSVRCFFLGPKAR